MKGRAAGEIATMMMVGTIGVPFVHLVLRAIFTIAEIIVSSR